MAKQDSVGTNYTKGDPPQLIQCGNWKGTVVAIDDRVTVLRESGVMVVYLHNGASMLAERTSEINIGDKVDVVAHGYKVMSNAGNVWPEVYFVATTG